MLQPLKLKAKRIIIMNEITLWGITRLRSVTEGLINSSCLHELRVEALDFFSFKLNASFIDVNLMR
jgi:hypothetical protein